MVTSRRLAAAYSAPVQSIARLGVVSAAEEIAVAIGQENRGGGRLSATRSAVGKIEHAGIRADLERFVVGAEVCLHYEEVPLALDAVGTIVATVVALDRTIGPEVTLGILDGLVEDSQRTALALRRGLGFDKNFESRCDIKEGTPPGSSTCVDAEDSVCYTLSSGSGCGGTSGRFQFVWDAGVVAD